MDKIHHKAIFVEFLISHLIENILKDLPPNKITVLGCPNKCCVFKGRDTPSRLLAFLESVGLVFQCVLHHRL